MPLSEVFSLVYLSSATVPFSEGDLLELLKQSRANNARLGISGMLLFQDGDFLQVLEGEEDKVRALYDKISLDPRHGRRTTLFQGWSGSRDFPDWSMGFHDLNSPDTAKIAGFTPFLDTRLTIASFSANPGRAKKLLLLFKEDNWLRTANI
jgi:Sensors of blue-light using FAD